MAKVTMPQLGESVAEGTIGKWLKNVGDNVAKYEPLLEVITDKVNAEVPSPVAGVLTKILVQEGETVPNNTEIAVIEEAGAAEADTASAAATAPGPAVGAAQAAAPAASTAVAAPPIAAVAAPAHGPAGSDERPTRSPAAMPVMAEPMAAVLSRPLPGDPDARMTPAVRRLLREHGLEAAQIVGSGGGGRLTRDDVLDFVEAHPHRAAGRRPAHPGSRHAGRRAHRRRQPPRPPPPPPPPRAPAAPPRRRPRRRSSSRPVPTKSSCR